METNKKARIFKKDDETIFIDYPIFECFDKKIEDVTDEELMEHAKKSRRDET